MRPIQPYEVQLRKPLPVSVYDSEGVLLLEAGFVVESPSMRTSLLERGFARDHQSEASYGNSTAPAQATDFGQATAAAAPSKSVSEQTRELRNELRDLLARMLAADGKALATPLLALRARLVALVDKDPEAAIANIQLGALQDSVTARPLYSGALAQLIGSLIALDEQQRLALVGAGLTYDCALMPLAAQLNQQTTPPTAQQRRMIHQHPLASAEVLQRSGINDPIWLEAVMHHHERLDGNGYPHQQMGRQLSLGARLLALVDTYCALVRPRAYRGAVDLTEALRVMFQQRSANIDADLALRFINHVGVYPPGGLVRLESQEIALVFRRGSTLGTPRVRVLLDSLGKADSSHAERNTARPGFHIIESLAPDRYAALLTGMETLWD